MPFKVKFFKTIKKRVPITRKVNLNSQNIQLFVMLLSWYNRANKRPKQLKKDINPLNEKSKIKLFVPRFEEYAFLREKLRISE